MQDSSDHGAAIHLPPAMNAVSYVQETLSDETWDTWTDTCSIRLDAAGHQCKSRTLFSPSLSVNNSLGLFNYHFFQHPNLTVTSSLFSLTLPSRSLPAVNQQTWLGRHISQSKSSSNHLSIGALYIGINTWTNTQVMEAERGNHMELHLHSFV